MKPSSLVPAAKAILLAQQIAASVIPIALTIAIAPDATAQEINLVHVTTAVEIGAQYALDLNSVSRHGSVVQYIQSIRGVSGLVVEQYSGDCSTNWIASLWWAEADHNGNILRSSSAPGEPFHTPPNSVGRQILDAACYTSGW